MSQPREIGYLWDMLNAARLILTFTAGMSRDAFEHDIKTQDAVVRRLEIIGEAVRRISADYQTAHPEIAWHAIVGMRNRLIHEYDIVDLDVVWGVVQHDILSLVVQLETLLGDTEA